MEVNVKITFSVNVLTDRRSLKLHLTLYKKGKSGVGSNRQTGYGGLVNKSHREKTGFLHIRKQRRRSASR